MSDGDRSRENARRDVDRVRRARIVAVTVTAGLVVLSCISLFLLGRGLAVW